MGLSALERDSDPMKTLTLDQIAVLAGLEPKPGPAKVLNRPTVSRVSGLDDATSDALVFAQDAASLTAAVASKAGIILAPPALVTGQPAGKDPRVLAVESPNVSIGPGAKILRGVELGSRVIVQAGAVLGSTGFGYVRHRTTGEYILFPQQGRLIVEDDVEIGANTTIDRGALGETRIGKGTKIDNLVQIGHNCRIGQHVVIASQVGISGSCVIEDGAILAGQVGLGDHVTIGRGVILGGQGGVYPGKTVTGEGEMFAGTPAEPVRDFLKTMAKVRRLK